MKDDSSFILPPSSFQLSSECGGRAHDFAKVGD
jgi:hypothetical protein